MMYTSQFHKIDPYDWFCAPGSRVIPAHSSSSSSPLLSLVQVPAKLAINLSIHTQHTYDNGVDRTGDRVFRKYSFLHEEREEEKKIFNPQTMLHLEYSLRTEKKNTSAQKHIYHKHMTLQQGETYPALASSHPVQCHAAPVSDLLALVAVQSISEIAVVGFCNRPRVGDNQRISAAVCSVFVELIHI